MKKYYLIRALLITLLITIGSTSTCLAEGEDQTAWNTSLKKQFFNEEAIQEDGQAIEISTPYRAEDPALVPIQINSKFPQSSERFIKNITIIIDNNPVPFSASFDFYPESGRADISTRMRINAYTFVRAIARTNDGKLHMAKAFVKASGGCSAPIGTDAEAALARLGKIKIKSESDKITLNQPNPIQILISHPNITGMQMDQISRVVKPPHFIDEIRVSFNEKPILTAKTDIAMSSDPNLKIFFTPDRAGELKVETKDNLGGKFSANQTFNP